MNPFNRSICKTFIVHDLVKLVPQKLLDVKIFDKPQETEKLKFYNKHCFFLPLKKNFRNLIKIKT